MDQSDFKPEFCVVGIGASAGGLGALRTLFSGMPPSPGFACVVVMHLPPQDESHLIEMLQPYTQMRVSQVMKTTALERNHVYVIPSDANLNSIDTHLRLSELKSPSVQRAPINHLLRSLAETHGETAIGIVLSGAGSDGALGMRQIKEHGGLTLAQDPQEAEYSSMPHSAIDTGAVDLVLSVRDMPDEISGYCSIEPSLAGVGDDDSLPERDAALLERILGAVRQRTGQEFAMYKRAKLLQRIRRRMRLRHVSSLEIYLEVLGETAEEARALYEDLLLDGTPLAAEHFDTGAIFRRAIERYAPPSVLVDREDRVVHFSAEAARYLRIPDGELSVDVLKLVPEVMVCQLRSGLQHVRREKRPWCSAPFVFNAENRAQRMVLRVDPYPPGLGTTNFWLVLFDDGISLVEEQQSGYTQQLEQLGNLQAELAAVHQPLGGRSGDSRRVAADCDTQQNHDRDLHRALQELDATREELQSVNKELLSVDAKSRHRIAALADASQELQHLLESSGYATLLLDKQLRIVRFTPLAAALLGLRDRDITRPLADLRHHLRYESLVEQLRGVALETQDFEAEVESEDGRWFLLRAQPYRNALRGIDGVVVLFLDITQRKTAELALRQSDRRKEEFLAVLAHELRNPLAPIAAGIELLRKLPDDSGLVLRVVATMSRQTKQLVRLVDDLLEVGRINEGKLLLHRERAAITEAVRDAVAALSPLVESLAHELTLELPTESPVVNGDPARLTQMVGNLLHNAVRYTPPRGKLALRVRCEGEQVVISVQDNGRGITAESLPNIFEMFYQERQGEGPGTGLGIGLTLAKKLVELHGGTITAESGGLDQGSTFSLRLPLAKLEQLPGPAPATHNDREAVDHHRVLIVDDNLDAAETLRLLMKSMGGKDVRTASSGPEALLAAAQLHPDIVLLDLSMPGMDGFEVARRMRAEPWGRTALLVALTGWGQDQHRRRSIEAGFDRHMTKPADVETLRAVLQT